ncbi:CRAL-TRIO domain-containing protein [Pseudoneurospora amorphoporcata]|uniref:Phosphatidylinositol transfer protein SFH5 n=1 Tax=Pseudoneurospora amorphoporcata TaxID=241081 RepID=A0AAN6NNJ3_9PEZI|nr:CRAL-TRIO domain-containing protein [Pseudoneurospora amorphoporcata]
MSTQPSDDAEPGAAPATANTVAANNETPTVTESEPDVAKPTQEEPKVAKPTELQAAAPIEAPLPATTAGETTEPQSAPAQDTDSPAHDKKPESGTASQLPPLAQLWKAAEGHAHFEIWGVPLSDPERHIPTQIIFQKFLNANDGDVEKAKAQLLKTLDWRQKTQPQQLVRKMFSKAKFDGLGYVTTYTAGDEPAVDEPEQKEVFTWNLYGTVKSLDETFGNLREFLEWRVALMELGLIELNIGGAIKPITADYDPYQMTQVHDYRGISFLRQTEVAKAASKESIIVLGDNYPELLKEKFFVNIPVIMGFLFGIMKVFVSKKTLKKFHPISSGTNLAREFVNTKVDGLGDKLPAEYGGKGADLKTLGKALIVE